MYDKTSHPPSRPIPTSARSGSALVSSLVLVIVVTAMIIGLTAIVLDSARQTNTKHETFRLRSHAESVASLTSDQVWGGFQNSGMQQSLTGFRTFLTGLGLAPGEVDFSNAANVSRDKDGTPHFGGVNVNGIWITRTDDGSSTVLDVSVTVSSDLGGSNLSSAPTRTITQSYVVAGGEWSGLDYALLANNVNCIMCHATIDTAERYYNTNPDNFGSYNRLKVGTLEHLLLRSNAESSIAGSLYVRGLATDKAGVPISDWASQTLNSVSFDAEGLLTQNVLGDLSAANLVPAGDPPGAMENLYLDYSMDKDSMVDGYLPESFPPPFPDDGGYDPLLGGPDSQAAGNRQVDDAEFAVVKDSAKGTITGGAINLSEADKDISTSEELAVAMNTGNLASLPGNSAGNVILTGTKANPIILNGDVAIDGDLILQGYVQGEGTLLVRGNVYMPSDVMYMDGATVDGHRTFGIAADGSTNSLGISAGGSMVVGDLFYKKPKKGKKGAPPTVELVTGDTTGAFNFVLSEVALFNRGEWMKTQEFLPAVGEDSTKPGTWTAPNGGYKGLDYLPRYYAFTEGASIPIFNQDGYYDPSNEAWVGKEHGSSWDSTNTYADVNDGNDPLLYDEDGDPIAVVQNLTTSDGWIPDSLLNRMMVDVISDRTETGAFKLDAWLYTNNSIFGITGKSSVMAGKMIVNGGILAADVGLLIPGDGQTTGLQLNYDRRPTGNIKLSSNEGITLTRTMVSYGSKH